MSLKLLLRHKSLPLSHVRLIAIALGAVILPAVALLILQYRSLSDVERKTRIAVHENLREAAEGVARSVEGDMERIGEEVILPVPPRFFVRKAQPWTEASAQEIFRKYPAIDELVLVADAGEDGDWDPVAYLYRPGRICSFSKSQWPHVTGIEQAIVAHRRADLLCAATAHAAGAPGAGAPSHFTFWQDRACDDCPDRYTYVSYCLMEPGTSREIGFVSFRLNMDDVRNQYLPALDARLSRSLAYSSTPAWLALGLIDELGRPICPVGPQPEHYEASASLAPVFPRWEATAGFIGTNVDQLARASFEKELWLTILVAAVLLAGIVLIVHAAGRGLRLAEAKQTFVSNVSHELKTPLALIRLFAETLEMRRAKTDEKAQEYYRIIHNESRRLSQLIDNILDFSRIEAGNRQYHFAPIDVSELVRSVVASYEYQTRAAGFEVEMELDPDLPRAEADPDAISQAVLNLLNNAVKYSGTAKRIIIRALAKAGGVVIEVEDRGIGIPSREHERIFENFYRVSTGLVHDTKGSGLGLAIVKHIAEAHRGRVAVESAPGKGSRFTLWLPAALPLDVQSEARAEGDRLAESVDHRG